MRHQLRAEVLVVPAEQARKGEQTYIYITSNGHTGQILHDAPVVLTQQSLACYPKLTQLRRDNMLKCMCSASCEVPLHAPVDPYDAPVPSRSEPSRWHIHHKIAPAQRHAFRRAKRLQQRHGRQGAPILRWTDVHLRHLSERCKARCQSLLSGASDQAVNRSKP
eukprot:3308453-Pleurochrysis_carterae.AAC.4